MAPKGPAEEKVTCRKCRQKFSRKLGTKNNGYRVTVKCPHCGTPQSVPNPT